MSVCMSTCRSAAEHLYCVGLYVSLYEYMPICCWTSLLCEPICQFVWVHADLLLNIFTVWAYMSVCMSTCRSAAEHLYCVGLYVSLYEYMPICCWTSLLCGPICQFVWVHADLLLNIFTVWAYMSVCMSTCRSAAEHLYCVGLYVSLYEYMPICCWTSLLCGPICQFVWVHADLLLNMFWRCWRIYNWKLTETNYIWHIV